MLCLNLMAVWLSPRRMRQVQSLSQKKAGMTRDLVDLNSIQMRLQEASQQLEVLAVPPAADKSGQHRDYAGNMIHHCTLQC